MGRFDLARAGIVAIAVGCAAPAFAGGAPAPVPEPGRASLESVAIAEPGDIARLERLGLDVTHDVSSTAATVALYSDAQRAELAAAGFDSTTLIPDLSAKSAADRRAEAQAAAGPLDSALPSGRQTYRTYDDYVNDLGQLAQDNPGLVRKVTIGKTVEGRDIVGVEIASEVNRTDDGRPAYLQMGIHHAREWPSGEFPMEFAIDLVEGFNSNDPRITSLLTNERVFVFPVINVDGFMVSRGAGSALGGGITVIGGFGEFVRRNCRPTGLYATPPLDQIPCALRLLSGVDLNRNYGYYWGGPGSSSTATDDTYRGPAPFSEPESEAVHNFVSKVQPTVFITNHTFTSGRFLRQPGFDATWMPQKLIPGYESAGCGAVSAGGLGAYTPDEDATAQLGEQMADATGYISELGYASLCDITGATEDWNYFAQGTYGYTPEARGVDFHDLYQTGVVQEYVGDVSHPGEGMREAFLRAGEEAIDEDNHGVIEGTAPPGATLKIHKEFNTPRHPSAPAGTPVDETLESKLTGPAGGTYHWHVMPSDRPQTAGGPLPAGDEQWTMTCQQSGQGVFSTPVEIQRGQHVTVDWAGGACGNDPVTNVHPVADFDFTPAAPAVGERINFLSTSTDEDGAIDPGETKWDLDDDGQFDDETGLTAQTTFATAGGHDVSIQVTDDDDASDVAVRTVTVAAAPTNAAPHADFSFAPSSPSVGENTVFTSTSTDSDGTLASLEWDIDGDGAFDDGIGGLVIRAYLAPGAYRVSLRATDDDEARDVEAKEIVVKPLAASPLSKPARKCKRAKPKRKHRKRRRCKRRR